MTIVLPGIAPNPIGGYKVAFEYANAMSRSGNAVRVLQAWDFKGGPRRSTLLQRVRRLARLKDVVSNKRPQWFELDAEIQVINRYTARAADVDGADIIVATAARTAGFVAAACDLYGVPGAYFIQHYEEWDLPAAKLRETWKLPLHKIVIAPWLVEVGESMGVTTSLVPNAIDPLEFPPGPPVKDRPLLVAAMLSPMPFKRADLICEMFCRVLDANPRATGVAFGVGTRPNELDPRVEYVQRPSRAQLRHVYQNARIYVCASDAEGWHLPPAEAMSSGAAVVSTEIGGVTAYAAGSARFVEPGDVDGLAQAVVEVLSDERLNSHLANLGSLAMKSYSPTRAAESFEKEIRSLL
ncbi:glycosyltransferase family 4 protein [Aeromicrobium wangtongii]|uniref:glycosyltransferase family 4 protein n=1 Tax=Aeromicrobium wangtongii TaxID=2969247 RepID=UPI0020177052|nr:glycosyltransferase family 4 protein [Aeromicrobium wangtongii]MCL3817236.1 glycosyltransferase family 4 protein [Aeromicrobium wangtongii]